ncbi:MAG TPA: dienelactone hydrolase family protein [Terriglobales bacterium]|nr:dienelactone hydrolase family protein [Terriglobales bacterium]
MAAAAIRGDDLSFVRDGETIRGYAAWQAREERAPAVIIIPDVHGLTDHYRDIARRFATQGFFSFALDLYSREGRPRLADLDAVQSWIASLDDRRVLGDIDGAVRFLRSRIEVRKPSIGITGFCMGGQYALLSACSDFGLSACVSFYGMLRYNGRNERKPNSPLDLAANLSCPYLGLFGTDDALIPREDVKELEGLLERSNKEFQIKLYPGAGHAFFNDARPDAYRAEAARDAWSRTIEFFRLHLDVV